jgi:hypothetical protein
MTGPTKMQTGVTAMNYDIREYAREKIRTITTELDDSLIKSRFDDPIDEAARQFTHKADCPITQRVFHKIIAGFVAHIYSKALNARWKASPEPLGYAIELLEGHYNSTYGRGYIAAAFDAGDACQGGIDAVLNQLAEIIKDIERQKYVNAIFVINIDPTDWPLKCQIVGILLEEYRQFLPEHLLLCRPWELANEIPSIMYRYIRGDSVLRQMVSAPGNFLSTENTPSKLPL